MKDAFLSPPRLVRRAFTLVEVVLAMGICSFVVTVVIGVLSVALQTHGQSSGTARAANTASRILAARRASPTNSIATNMTGAAVNPILLPRLNQALTPGIWTGAYISEDGTVVPKAEAAFYALYQAGTNSDMGDHCASVDLQITWPAVAQGNSPNRYEVYTLISW